MPKLRVHNFAISLDGYGAGRDQSTDNPLGVGGERLHEWAFATRTFRQVHRMEGGDEGGGERFFEHLGTRPALYECVEFVSSGSVAHTRLVRVAE